MQISDAITPAIVVCYINYKPIFILSYLVWYIEIWSFSAYCSGPHRCYFCEVSANFNVVGLQFFE